ncbi:MAG: autotransporter outer membrane beta-barrel domain-containing protein, partial [Endozoicomonas sp.]
MDGLQGRFRGIAVEVGRLNRPNLRMLTGIVPVLFSTGVLNSGFCATPSPEIHSDPSANTVTLSHTESIPVCSRIVLDTSTRWKVPGSQDTYFKVIDRENEDQFAKSLRVRTAIIPSAHLLSSAQQISMKSPPVVADKMNQEVTFVAYDRFTGVTRSLFTGRIPHNAIVSYHEDLFQTVPPFRWLASNTLDENDNQAVDYLGQREGEDTSYGSRLAEGAKSMMKGPWVTVFQLYGHYLDQDPVSDLPGFKSSGYGIQGAILHPAGEVWLVGLYGAWQRLTADMRSSDAEVESGVWRLGPAFALGSGSAHMEGLITYSWGKVDNKDNRYSGNYSNRQWDLFVRGGYDFDMEHMARGLTLTPELQALYSNQSRDAFNWQYDNVRISSASSSGWAT